jgi:hypothetical protein
VEIYLFLTTGELCISTLRELNKMQNNKKKYVKVKMISLLAG